MIDVILFTDFVAMIITAEDKILLNNTAVSNKLQLHCAMGINVKAKIIQIQIVNWATQGHGEMSQVLSGVAAMEEDVYSKHAPKSRLGPQLSGIRLCT